LRAEVEAVLAGGEPPPAAPQPLRVLLVAGPKDHGPGEHDYPAWLAAWSRLLAMAEGVSVRTAEGWPTEDQWESADVAVFYQQGTWTPQRARAIDAFLARGGGLVYLHYAVDGGADPPGFAERIGLAWQGGRSRFRHGELDLGFAASEHPISRNFASVRFHDESYWQLVGDPAGINVLASGQEDGGPQPLFWTLERGRGRVFVSIPGHFAWTFDDPLFRILVLRGIAWTGRQPTGRLEALAWPGARVGE
jgi:type 1 glutamine amidotransferase